jgi:uncharacterized protein YcbX
MLIVSQLFIYPVKSLGGIEVSSAFLTERGFEHDRRWMLVDANNRFISQRELSGLALLQVSIIDQGLKVTYKHGKEETIIPFEPLMTDHVFVTIWDDICLAQLVSETLNEWFSRILSFPCKLVYMPDSTHRKVDVNYASNDEITSFADGYPLLIIGQSSLNELNKKLAEPLPIERFRPNIVFTGGTPHEEDLLEYFTISEINFYGVKPCARCVITTVDQQTAEKGKEPLKTLATYRLKNSNVYFGQNLLHKGSGEIKVGDIIDVRKRSVNNFL